MALTEAELEQIRDDALRQLGKPKRIKDGELELTHNDPSQIAEAADILNRTATPEPTVSVCLPEVPIL